MKKILRILTVLLSVLLLSGCSNIANTDVIPVSSSTHAQKTSDSESDDVQTSESQSQEIPDSNSDNYQTSDSSTLQTALDVSEMFTVRDSDTGYDENTSAMISLDKSSATCSSDAVNISGSTVTILDEGTYIFSGKLDNGMIVVNADKNDKVQLILDGVSINNNTSAAVYVAQADKVFITLASDSQNNLSNGGEFDVIDDNNIDAAVFSKDDLTLNGEGALTISSPTGHGIVSKDDLVVTGGEYSINAAKQGLSGKESVRIADGSFNITAGKDGIHAEDSDDTSLGFVYIASGVFNITADSDGISASNAMQIDDGNFTVKTGGGSETVTFDSNENPGRGRAGEQQNTNSSDENTISAKGLKAGGNLLINNGMFEIDSADDALHSNENLTLNGSTCEISSGDDGLHADETTTVTNGNIVITKSYEGIEGNNVFISGGVIDLISADDGLNAAGGNDQSGNGNRGFQQGSFDASSDSSITISGGTIHINASGDGVDSNGSLFVTGGETYVSGPTGDGNGALDYNKEATISGGVFFATGSSGMAQNFGDTSTQGSMLISVSGSVGDDITLTDNSTNTTVNWSADKSFSSVLISCPEIRKGESYTVTVGDDSQNITMDSLIYGFGGGAGGKSGGGRSGKDMKTVPGTGL